VRALSEHDYARKGGLNPNLTPFLYVIGRDETLCRVLLHPLEPPERDQTGSAPGAGGGTQLLPQPTWFLPGPA